MAVRNTGVPGATVKPVGRASTWPPVVRVMARGPGMAAGSILKTAVALTGELTVRLATATPAPKVAVVLP